MGRPSKLTGETQSRIVTAIRAGNYAESACAAAGISASTYYRWIQRGESEPASAYGEFREAVRQAEAEAEVHAVAIIRRAMSDDWRAALAYLERRHPARWRRQQVTELTGKDGSPLWGEHEHSLDLSRLSDEQLLVFQQLAEQAATDTSEE